MEATYIIPVRATHPQASASLVVDLRDIAVADDVIKDIAA